MRTPVVDGQSIEQFIPANLRHMFYQHPMPEYKYAIRNGYGPYGFSTNGLVLYLPLWALKDSSFKSVDANRFTCTPSGTTIFWTPTGWDLAGVNEIITIGNIGTAIKTLEFWFNPASTAQSILEERDGVGVTCAAGSMLYGSWNDCFVNGVNTDVITAAWQQITLTSIAGVNMSAFRFGLVAAVHLDGRVGEIRAYTTMKVAADALYSYNSTAWRYQSNPDNGGGGGGGNPIDIGAEAIGRTGYQFPNATLINKENPANASGTITSVEIFALDGYDLLNCVVGTFYTINGNRLKCRDSVAIGAVTGGSKRTFSELSLLVEAGDYIGIYYTDGYIENAGSGYAGVWDTGGEHIDPGDEATYNLSSDDAISLKGIGEEG